MQFGVWKGNCRMSAGAGIFNCFVLLGVSLFCFRFCWAFVFGTAHGVLKVIGRGRGVTLSLFLLIWGYFLSSQTVLIVAQAQQTRDISGTGYEWIAMSIFTLFIFFDRCANIWIAERKLDVVLQEIVKQQHFIVAGIWICAVLTLWFWPDGWHLGVTRWWVGEIQKMLSVPVLGFCLSVLGILYELGMIRRILKFIRIGPKGLPPFPDSIRN